MRARLNRSARACATAMALSAGGLQLAVLWQEDLSQASLLTAGRGVLLLLLGLGLMGTAQLSLVLALLLCVVPALEWAVGSGSLSLVSACEMALLICAGLALFTPPVTQAFTPPSGN